MRRSFLVLLATFLTMALATPIVSAQTPTISDGCQTLDGETGDANASLMGNFDEDEVIIVTVSSADGGEFTVTIAGEVVLNNADTGSSGSAQVAADGSVMIDINVVNGTGTFEIDCISASGENPDDIYDAYEDGTICHKPPGNPAAQHTITVGSPNAVEAHLGHGDELGPCPEGTETRNDIPSLNITIFVINATNTLQVYGNCDDGCEEVTNVPITILINFGELVIVTGDADDDDADDDADDDDALEEGTFIEVENPEDYGYQIGEATEGGLTTIVYYLHPDPTDSTVGVFQINVYENDTLINDSTLVFISSTGSIVFWADQSYWELQLAQSESD